MNEIIRAALDGEILSPKDSVRVIGKLHPLNGARVRCDVPAGLSIGEILRETLERARPGMRTRRDFVIELDGHSIPEANWERVRPKPGTTITFRVRLQGGDGATLKAVLGLAVAVGALIAAPYLAPTLIAGASALGITLGTTAATALAAGGIVLAGTLALNALFPTRPAEDLPGSTPLNSIQGAQNTANPFGPVPVVLGRHRQSPYFAAKAYTEIVGDDQWLRVLFCMGYGPLVLEDFRIGETPLSSYPDYQIEVRQGFVGDSPVTLYPGQVDEVALAITLTNPHDQPGVNGPTFGDWSAAQTTSPETQGVTLDFAAPNGINATDNKGNRIPWGVQVGVQYRRVGAVSWTDLGVNIGFAESYSPIRRGISFALPANGQYEVRARQLTGNGNPQYTRDTIVWSAIRSMSAAPPITFPKPLALIALRIKATDQLSGNIDTFNCVCTSLVNAYSGSGDTWTANTASQNPADLFRHVLQGPANARPRADAQVDLENLQDWHTYCATNSFRFNQVVNSTGSVYDKLADIAAAGRASLSSIDGKWGVSWDRPDDPVVQHFTPRNSWGFQGQRVYAQQPHGWRASFINEDNGWTEDERIVYDDGYSVSNATLFEGISFPGVTDSDLVWRHGRFHIAQARLRPETVTLNVGWEHLICTRGDRVLVTHDVLLIGLKSGRVTNVVGQVVSFDERVTIEDGKTYGFTFRVPQDARSIELAVDVTPGGEYTSLTLIGDLSLIVIGTLFGFGETSRESAVYRLQGIAHQKDLIATLTLVDDAPEISEADQGTIPVYNPNVTIPTDPFSLPPRDLRYLEVIDGKGATIRALVRLTWQVPRFGKIDSFEVQNRFDDGAGDWTTVATPKPPTVSADIATTAAGIWSFRVRCIFDDGTVSAWTSIIGVDLLGLSFAPGDVTNLHQRTIDGQTVLDWTIVPDQRILFYEIRKGTSWDTGLVVGDSVAQPPWPTTGDGTYHIRAYVLSPFGTRIYSTNEMSIEIEDSIISRNIIVSRDEQATGWTGKLEGGTIDGSFIRTDTGLSISLPWAQEVIDNLALTGTHIAVYLTNTSNIVDIGQPNECRFWTLFEADGITIGEDFLGQTDVLGSDDALGVAPTRLIQAFPIWRFADGDDSDVFAPSDIFSPPDIFTTNINWGSWTAIASGQRVSRYYQPGYVLITNDEGTNAVGTKFSWFVDVPDRTDDYTDLSVPDTGLDITFYKGGYNTTPTPGIDPLHFNGGPNGSDVPHIQSAIINPTNGDSVKVTSLTASGCTIHVVNAGSFVTRTGVNILARGF